MVTCAFGRSRILLVGKRGSVHLVQFRCHFSRFVFKGLAEDCNRAPILPRENRPGLPIVKSARFEM